MTLLDRIRIIDWNYFEIFCCLFLKNEYTFLSCAEQFKRDFANAFSKVMNLDQTNYKLS
eukprot:UN23434